jgi:hypothetical protein
MPTLSILHYTLQAFVDHSVGSQARRRSRDRNNRARPQQRNRAKKETQHKSRRSAFPVPDRVLGFWEVIVRLMAAMKIAISEY